MQVVTNFLVNGLTATTVGGTGTSVKYFPNIPGSSIGVANTTPSSSSARGQLSVPGNSALNGQDFEVVVIGAVNTDSAIACPTVTVALYANTGTVASPSYTAIATTGGITGASLSLNDEPFAIRARLSGDSASGIVGGFYTAMYNGVLVNSTQKATTLLSSINFANDVPFGLVVGVTFSVSGANNLATLYQFSLAN
jgi:hypothetical protein